MEWTGALTQIIRRPAVPSSLASILWDRALSSNIQNRGDIQLEEVWLALPTHVPYRWCSQATGQARPMHKPQSRGRQKHSWPVQKSG